MSPFNWAVGNPVGIFLTSNQWGGQQSIVSEAILGLVVQSFLRKQGIPSSILLGSHKHNKFTNLNQFLYVLYTEKYGLFKLRVYVVSLSVNNIQQKFHIFITGGEKQAKEVQAHRTVFQESKSSWPWACLSSSKTAFRQAKVDFTVILRRKQNPNLCKN